MKTIVYSAPTGFILSGGLSINYGKPALILSSDNRLICKLSEGGKQNEKFDIEYLDNKIKQYLVRERISFEEKKFNLLFSSSDSSLLAEGNIATCIVLSVASLLNFYTGKSFSKEIINSLAYTIVKRFNKWDSGIHTSISTYGGIMYFRKEFEFLKQISYLSFKIPETIEKNLYILADSNKLTKQEELDNKVRLFYNNNPKESESLMNKLESITKKICLALMQENELMFRQMLMEKTRSEDKINPIPEKFSRISREAYNKGIGLTTISTEQGIKLLGFSKEENIIRSFAGKFKMNCSRYCQSSEGLIYG